jgi:hypothetical protein
MDNPFTGFSKEFRSVWGTSATDVYVAGGAKGYTGKKGDGAILHYDGVSWKLMTTVQTPRYFYNLWGADEGKIHALSGPYGWHTYSATTYKLGDENGDGTVNISDIVSIINLVLSSGTVKKGGDCNQDGIVDIRDIICTINKVLAS